MDEELRKIQLVQLDIAKEIARICTENNIDYIMIGGTLLGAIRHSGFIPWDDDLDFGFTRENYDKFLEVAPKCMRSQYYLQEWSTDWDYANPFGKVRMNGTKFVESSIKNRNSHMGIFVDIFPYDNYPSKPIQQKMLKTKLVFLRQAIVLKTRYCEFVSKTGKRSRQVAKVILFPVLWTYASFHSKEALVKRFNTISQKYNGKPSDNVYEHSGASPYGKWVVPIRCFMARQKYKFEDTYFEGPEDYDQYLTAGYGDYMTPPPEDKRTNRHGIVQIDFGDLKINDSVLASDQQTKCNE